MKNARAAVRRHSARVYAMSNYVLKYSRDERVKYISHLDFVRMFHRTVRRSGLKMVFSQGFNPHPVMTVACPLSVGITASGELMKIGFEDGYTEEEILSRLNGAFPPGFAISKVKRAEGKEPDFRKIERGEYIIEALVGENADIDADKFINLPEILVMKKTKSGEKETDIKKMIHSVDIISRTDDTVTLKAVLDCGNISNLKPDTLISAMNKYIPNCDCKFYKIHRSALLRADNSEIF